MSNFKNTIQNKSANIGGGRPPPTLKPINIKEWKEKARKASNMSQDTSLFCGEKSKPPFEKKSKMAEVFILILFILKKFIKQVEGELKSAEKKSIGKRQKISK